MRLKYYISSALLGSLLLFSGCEKQIQEEVFSQLDPATLFKSANGIERVLFGAYADAEIIGNLGGNTWFQEEWTCDQVWETGGAVNLQAVVMLGFTWDSSYPTQFTTNWNLRYSSIRNCNLVLENIEGSPVDATTKARLIAEARFVRATSYYILYNWCGPVPLRLSTTSEPALARATDAEMRAFFEKEFTEVAAVLPNRGELSGYQYGRATKGAALGYLCKYYLNTKQWQKSADAAKQLMDLGIYQLWPDYNTLFTVDNEEKNKEYIWAYPCSVLGPGNEFMNGIFPPSYKSAVDGSMPFLSNMRNWARMDRLKDSFFNSFDPADSRKKLILTAYINTNGQTVSLLNQDNTRPFKFVPDPNAVANAHGNDLPVIRYADILLARAEALNEISGPTQEALNLIQMVRDRAQLKTPLVLANYTKETLRTRILQERGWELYIERVRREDLIRNGTFISGAIARGVKNAKEYHVLFPIPQTEINANPLCKQNPGY